jgi:hypothetical protein
MTPESPIGACSFCGFLAYVEVAYGGPKNRRRHACAACGGKVAKAEVKATPLRFTRIKKGAA